jgi:hypothetical protein
MGGFPAPALLEGGTEKIENTFPQQGEIRLP